MPAAVRLSMPIRPRDALFGALAALAAAAAYLPALGAGFTADDWFVLARVRDHGGLANSFAYFGFAFFDYYRPLGFLSYALDWELWGLNAFGFHMTSVALHAGNTALVYVLARRLSGRGTAALAAGLFGLHAGGHETVYWVAARFDLLATFLVLVALLLVTSDRRGLYLPGAAAFACALLAKESAAALPLIAAVWDAVVARRSWVDVTRRAAPLLVVGAAYVLLRSLGAGLAADGGRLPKLVLFIGSMTGLILLTRAGVERVLRALVAARLPKAPLWVAIAGLVAAAAAMAPASSGFVLEKLGFIAYVVWVLASPWAFPPPPAWPFVPASVVQALPGLAAGLAAVGALWAGRAWLAARPAALFAAWFAAAALVPVLSMTGGTRYVYLASTGAAMLAAQVLEAAASRRPALVVVFVVAWLSVSGAQLFQAASAWRWAGNLSRQAIDVMASDAPGCRSRTVVMVTAPVGLRGVYSNLLWEGLAVGSNCPPAAIVTLLRVVAADAIVGVERPSLGRIDLRVPDYAGQFVASRDSRRYDVEVPAGATMSVDTPLGRIDTWPEDDAQRFRVTLRSEAVGADYFAYSAGIMHAIGAGR